MALVLSRLALGMGLLALLVALFESRSLRRRTLARRKLMAFATLALGMALFALFFGLVAACDRL